MIVGKHSRYRLRLGQIFWFRNSTQLGSAERFPAQSSRVEKERHNLRVCQAEQCVREYINVY